MTNLPNYIRVFIALAVLTVIEVLISRITEPRLLVDLTLIALAVSKAALVALYYMHLRYERKMLTYMALSPFVLSAILTIMLLSDTTLKHLK